jgi:hypothetical protein
MGAAAAGLVGSPWLSTLTRVMVQEEDVGVSGVGVRWKICIVRVLVYDGKVWCGCGCTDLNDSSPMTREDEFALTPFVAHALVYGDGRDAFGVFFAVADVFVE